MTEQERLLRANQAALELPRTEAAFAELRASIIEKWASTAIDQVMTREKLFLSVQVLDSVRKALVQSVADGQVLKHSAEVAALLAPAAEDRRR